MAHTEPAAASDPLADVDLSTTHKVRTMYAYTGQRAEDLSFGENLIISAHPSKSGSDWWYGTLVSNGSTGFIPKAYVEVIEHAAKATALYAYAGGGPEELPFEEGESLSIIDKSDADWWKAEKGGLVFIVPAGYLELDAPKPLLESVSQHSMQPVVDASGAKTVDEVEDDSDSDDDSAAYVSFSDSEPDEAEDDTVAEEDRKAYVAERDAERARVLEAAGLVLEKDPTRVPPPPPPRRSRNPKATTKTRRAPPPIPEASVVSHSRLGPIEQLPRDRDLPPTPVTPTSPRESILIGEADAYDKYENFRRASSQISNNNRFSTISASSDTPSSPISIAAPSLTPSLGAKEESSFSRLFGSGLGLLGRTTSQASGASERKSTLVISGPVGIPDVPERSSSPAFGMSWSSLVSKDALEGIPPIERRRQEAIFELIVTEGAYVRDLQLIVEASVVLTWQLQSFYGPALEMLSQEDLDNVFANIEEILLCNTTFFSSLEERQKESRLYIDSVTDILESHAPAFEIYEKYCVNQGPATNHLTSLRQSKPDFGAHLTKLRNDPATRNLELSSYLLVPMQRITRYPLLIKQILNNTEADNEKERGALTHSIHLIEGILDRINEAVRDREGREILAEVSKDLWVGQSRLDLTAPTRYMGPRKLIKEGIVLKKKRRIRALLCTDILVLTDAATRSLYQMYLELFLFTIHYLDDHVFEVQLAYPRGGDVIKLRASSAKECINWIKALERASGRCREVARGLR
ncbi:Dbl homology domain-containing protein [Clavulina sp. PMI_390]|nr:Dbl homology domain-containing protein [Clavulina sp. PMI_390]